MNKVLSIHTDHDGSVTYVENSQVVFHTQLDRYNRHKHCADISKKLFDYLYQLDFDTLLITSLYVDSLLYLNNLFHSSKKWLDKLQKVKIIQYGFTDHHLFHAYGSLSWNKFTDCTIVVMDGSGSPKKDEFGDIRTENETVYNFNKNLILKHKTFKKIGKRYQTTSNWLMGDCWFNDGKTMALSLYGKYTSKLIDQKNIRNTIKKSDKEARDIAYSLQFCTEKDVLDYFEIKKITGNVIFTGGVAQNVLLNSKLNKKVNLFADPLNGDFGISLGSANYYLENTIKINNVNLGIPQKLNFNNMRNVTVQEVAQLLTKEPVAIFQSRSEQGQRGLGYRSLLISPSCKQAFKKINDIKKREWYRPFSLSCLKEEAHKWFDIPKGEESPFMMNVYKIINKKNIYTGYAIDDSCRIQTVGEEHVYYYNLIKEVYKLTKVPMLVNTSLNSPGEVLVETPEDLEEMMRKTKLKYAYVPEINKIIY